VTRTLVKLVNFISVFPTLAAPGAPLRRHVGPLYLLPRPGVARCPSRPSRLPPAGGCVPGVAPWQPSTSTAQPIRSRRPGGASPSPVRETALIRSRVHRRAPVAAGAAAGAASRSRRAAPQHTSRRRPSPPGETDVCLSGSLRWCCGPIRPQAARLLAPARCNAPCIAPRSRSRTLPGRHSRRRRRSR